MYTDTVLNSTMNIARDCHSSTIDSSDVAPQSQVSTVKLDDNCTYNIICIWYVPVPRTVTSQKCDATPHRFTVRLQWVGLSPSAAAVPSGQRSLSLAEGRPFSYWSGAHVARGRIARGGARRPSRRTP